MYVGRSPDLKKNLWKIFACMAVELLLPGLILLVRPRTILNSVSWCLGCLVSTQISKQANAPIAKHIIICQDADHNTTVQSVCRTCIHTTGCTTQSDIAQENWHLHVLKFFGISVHIVEGSYTNFKTSKYVEEVIEVDELDKDFLSAAAGEDK